VNLFWYATFLAIGFCIFLTSSIHAQPQAQPKGKAFATPKEAADALIKAAADYNVTALREILGTDAEDLVASEDPVQDKNRASAFAARAKEKEEVTIDPEDKSLASLTVGNDGFLLPIPIVRVQGKWYFDTVIRREEVLNRRIGANELQTINTCRGYVEAQEEYARSIHDGSGVNQYSQRFVSTPGKQDGLAWQNSDGTWGGPVGPGAARAIEQGYTREAPFHGYYFKVLKGQGPSARLGQLDYVIKGAMIGGFALVAWPAEYRVTGVQTFIVSYDGVVYQKDLGPNTAKIATAIDRYDPDKTWRETKDDLR
jgi:hypothetical protein